MVTLFLLGSLVRELTVDGMRILVATGDDRHRRDLLDELSLERTAEPFVALCSDAHAQAVNLQGASALVHLDFPSVIRIAEQRIGRIDRMDSPHPEIEIYWPSDHEAFALRSDELFLARHRLVERLLGANIALPEGLSRLDDQARKTVRAEDVIEEVDHEMEQTWTPTDALDSVRQLVYGKRQLVPEDIYDEVRESSARVVSTISVIESESTYGFFAIAGSGLGSPRWAFVDPEADVRIDLDHVTALLRKRLAHNPLSREFDDEAERQMKKMLQMLREAEEYLLPKISQRALVECRTIVKKLHKRAADASERAVYAEAGRIVNRYQPYESVDLRFVADWWLQTIHPIRLRVIELSGNRRKPLLLRDLRKHIVADPPDIGAFRVLLETVETERPLEQRVVAAILGVPS